ncbi:MAG TPA: DUF2510 domain-containing protein, partial [Nocardioides sp.]|nr:DUF2510 domain-containing protein [Nocardioides sp.]
MTPANWHPDPTGRHELRYWDGTQWTEHVSDQGTVGSDPLEASSAPEQSQYAEQGHAETQLIDARELAAEQPAEQPQEAPAEASAEVSADPATGWVQPSAEPPAYRPVEQQPVAAQPV